jgi:hypothetical protein
MEYGVYVWQSEYGDIVYYPVAGPFGSQAEAVQAATGFVEGEVHEWGFEEEEL